MPGTLSILAVLLAGAAYGWQGAGGPGPAADVAKVLANTRKAPPLAQPAGVIVRVRTAAELRRAVEEAAPGTTVLLADGRYPIDELLVTGHRLTIRGESGDREKVILDGEGRFTRIVRVRGAKDLTIADLTVANSRQYGVMFLGDSGVERLTVYNVKFHNCYTRGLTNHDAEAWTLCEAATSSGMVAAPTNRLFRNRLPGPAS